MNTQELYDIIENSNLPISEVMKNLYAKNQIYDFLVVADKTPTLVYVKFSEGLPFKVMEIK